MPLGASRPISPSASESDVAAPLPKRLSQLGNILNPNSQQQQLRRGSGANMGYGGYTPTFISQQYGEPDTEHDHLYEQFGVRKSMDDVEWEMKLPKTVAVNLGGKDLKDEYQNGGLHASSSQTSLLPHSRARGQDSPPRTWTPERYTTSPDVHGQQQPLPPPPPQAQAQAKAHPYPPGLNTGSPATLSANTTLYPPPPQPPPTYPTSYQQTPHLPTDERRVFQPADAPVSYPPQQQPPSNTPGLPDGSMLPPDGARYSRPSEPPLDRPYNNPYSPAYQYPLYSPSQSGYSYPTSTNADQTGHGVQLPTSTSTFSNTSSDHSYSEHTALTNPHSPDFDPSQRNQRN